MRRRSSLIVLLALLLSSCGPGPGPAPTTTPIPTVPAHAPEIRFGLIGGPRDVNVWELFDERGASYADYALRFEYWPRLFHLPPTELIFQPLAAEGLPSSVIQEDGFYSATVKLRPDLKWTDGSAFTAGDVAFTINTALAFELGYDWNAYYSRDYLDRAEAADPSTVKFVFEHKPNVGIWQYGALQGPVVQESFWGPIIGDASALLPDEALRAQVDGARTYLAKARFAIDDLTAQVNALRLTGRSDRMLEARLTNSQEELIYAQNTLDKLLVKYDAGTASAREALFALDDTGEPTLGAWVPAGKMGDAWVNEANPDFPFIQPNFDRAIFEVFGSREEAFEALQNDEVDMILDRDGRLSSMPSNVASVTPSPAGSASYLVFNPADPNLVDPSLHQAIACMLWYPSRSLSGVRSDFLLPGNRYWHHSEAMTPCEDLGDENPELLKRERAIQILKSAGYAWEVEPANESPGSVLLMPNGQPLPTMKLLAPADEDASLDFLNSKGITDSLSGIGIAIVVEYGSPQDIRFEVFSSKGYDLAILRWRLGLYPGYLCDWFGTGAPFDYGSERLKAECEALQVDADLESARRHVREIQSILAQDMPFIPLYADIIYDAYRNIRYPFEGVLGGLSGLYGAPSHAMPSK